jgi:hypothetical protein
MVVGISALQELVYSYVGTVVCQRGRDQGGSSLQVDVIYKREGLLRGYTICNNS